MTRWLKEPLLHFLLLGALIFLAYGWLASDGPSDDEILVTSGQQTHLVTAFTRTWQRPPTQEEFNNLVDDWIREEIAYREGMELGLDTDDTIIRRRLRQKLELLAEDVVSLVKPTEEELQAFLEEHQDDYRRDAVYTLRQVYFSEDRRGDQAWPDAEQTLVLLATNSPVLNQDTMGDPLPLPDRLEGASASALGAQFGTVFSESLVGLEAGRWQGPVRSGFGVHLVLIESLEEGRPMSLDEARVAVERDLANQRRLDTINELYDRLRERYEVTVEPMQAEAPAP